DVVVTVLIERRKADVCDSILLVNEPVPGWRAVVGQACLPPALDGEHADRVSFDGDLQQFRFTLAANAQRHDLAFRASDLVNRIVETPADRRFAVDL